jgi:SprT-like protein
MLVDDWKAMERKIENTARRFLKEAYGFELAIPVKVNGRMKSKHGCFWSKRGRKESVRIDIAKVYIENQDWETIYSTIKHECIHYVCYEMDKPYNDGDDYFESELKKHGSHSTRTVPYRGKVVEYVCTADGCSTVYQKKKKYPRNGKGYTSGCCKAPIKFNGEKVLK